MMQNEPTQPTCPFCHKPLRNKTVRFCGHCGQQIPHDEFDDAATIVAETLVTPTVYASPVTMETPTQQAPPPYSPPLSHTPTATNRGAVYLFGKRISSGLFAAVLLCFFLPFITVSCGPTNITMSGIDLVRDSVTHTLIDGTESLPLSIVVPAVLLLVAVVVGIVVGFVQHIGASVVGAVAGVLGVASLLMLKAAITDALLAPNAPPDPITRGLEGLPSLADNFLKSSGIIDVTFLVGYWLALGLFLVAFILQAWLIVRTK